MSKKVVLGVLNTLTNHSEEYQSHIKSITYFSLLLEKYRNSHLFYEYIIEKSEIDNLIKSAYSKKAKWLFLVSYGQRFHDNDCIAKIITHAENTDAVFLGHILQTTYPDGSLGEDQYSIHHQNFLLNLEEWNNMGRPLFGTEGTYQIRKHIPERSSDNFHDNYTPYWLKPTKTYKTYNGYLGTGWNFINTALNKGYTLNTFPSELKNKKSFFYPEDNSKEFSSALRSTDNIPTDGVYRLSNISQNSYLAETCPLASKNVVYALNTDQPGIDYLSSYIKKSTIKNIYAPASGFKALFLLAQTNWNSSTRIIYFDFSPISIVFKKWLLENWDGRDYIDALKRFKLHFPNVSFICNKEVDLDNVYEDFKTNLKYTIEFFGGERRWVEYWEKTKKLEHKFIICNLLEDYSQITNDMLEHKGINLMWISNIFFSETTIRFYPPVVLLEKYNSFIKECTNNSEIIEIIGARPIDNYLYDFSTE